MLANSSFDTDEQCVRSLRSHPALCAGCLYDRPPLWTLR
jgi:hypothetical protein